VYETLKVLIRLKNWCCWDRSSKGAGTASIYRYLARNNGKEAPRHASRRPVMHGRFSMLSTLCALGSQCNADVAEAVH
jgi:hypothetical protein